MIKQAPVALTLSQVGNVLRENPAPLLLNCNLPIRYSDKTGFSFQDRQGVWLACGLGATDTETLNNFVKAKAPFKAGDLLWVRETFCVGRYDEHDAEHPDDRHLYIDQSADPDSYTIFRQDAIMLGASTKDACWRPSTNMPKALSRLTLKVTFVTLGTRDGRPLFDAGNKDNFVWFVTFDVLHGNINSIKPNQ